MVSLSNKLFYKALENTRIIKHTINDLLEILGETQQFEGLPPLPRESLRVALD